MLLYNFHVLYTECTNGTDSRRARDTSYYYPLQNVGVSPELHPWLDFILYCGLSEFTISIPRLAFIKQNYFSSVVVNHLLA